MDHTFNNEFNSVKYLYTEAFFAQFKTFCFDFKYNDSAPKKFNPDLGNVDNSKLSTEKKKSIPSVNQSQQFLS